MVGPKLIDPEFIIFAGPMFGSKTTRMLATLERFKYQKKRIVAFKPRMDSRYSDEKIVTHAGGSWPAQVVSKGSELLEAASAYDVVAVDEAFMIDGIAGVLIELFRSGKTIVVSSIQLSASGAVFSEVRDMMPWATKIDICPAVCPITGRNAYYTHRKIENIEEIMVGGEELYEPRCWEHYPYINRSGE